MGSMPYNSVHSAGAINDKAADIKNTLSSSSIYMPVNKDSAILRSPSVLN